MLAEVLITITYFMAVLGGLLFAAAAFDRALENRAERKRKEEETKDWARYMSYEQVKAINDRIMKAGDRLGA